MLISWGKNATKYMGKKGEKQIKEKEKEEEEKKPFLDDSRLHCDEKRT